MHLQSYVTLGNLLSLSGHCILMPDLWNGIRHFPCRTVWGVSEILNAGCSLYWQGWEVRLLSWSAPLQSEEGRLRFTLKSTVFMTEPQTCWLLSLCSTKLRNNVLINNIYIFGSHNLWKQGSNRGLKGSTGGKKWTGSLERLSTHMSFSTNILLFKGPSSP